MTGAEAAPSEAWFEARVEGDEVVTRSQAEALIGHRLPSPDLPAGGDWVEWRWDGETLEVRNDRYGAYPVYYAATVGSIAISPSIDVLLRRGVARDLDLDAVAVFLAVGYYVGTDTQFGAIRALPGGVDLRWRQGHLAITADRAVIPVVAMSRQQAIEGSLEVVRAAVRRSIPAQREGYVMPVSGGRDSRHLLLELIRAGHPPALCVTTAHHQLDWGGDVPYASRLCAELGLEHRILAPGRFAADEWRKNRLTSYCTDQHAWFLSVADELTGTTSHTFDGFNGSSTLAHPGNTVSSRQLVRARDWDGLAAWMGKKQDDGQARFAALLGSRSSELLDGDRAAARIRKELDLHLAAPEPALSLRFQSYSMRELSLTCNAMLGSVPTVYTPFNDPELVRFSWSTSLEHVDSAFHTEVIARAFPEYAHIPYLAKTKPKPSRCFRRQVARDLFALLRRKSDGSLLDRAALMRRAARSSVYGDDWFMWGRRAHLTTYLVQLETIVAGESLP